MLKYHDSGTVCKATKRPCPLGADAHIEANSSEEFERKLENKMKPGQPFTVKRRKQKTSSYTVYELTGSNIRNAFDEAQVKDRSENGGKGNSETISGAAGFIEVKTRKAGVTQAEASFLPIREKRYGKANIIKSLNESTLKNDTEVHKIVLKNDSEVKKALRSFYDKNSSKAAIVSYSTRATENKEIILEIETQEIEETTKSESKKWWAIGNYSKQ